jgi:hypothetical protein
MKYVGWWRNRMNVILDRNAIEKVVESFSDLTVKQIFDMVTLNVQGKLGVRRIGKKFHLKKDKVHRVLKKYQYECSKTQLKPSRLELKVVKLGEEVEALSVRAELKRKKDEYEKLKVSYSLKVYGNPYVEKVIIRRLMKHFTKEKYFTEIRELTVGYWPEWSLDNVLRAELISSRQLLDTFNDWYDARATETYPGTGRLATGEECLALEIYLILSNEVRELIRHEKEICELIARLDAERIRPSGLPLPEPLVLSVDIGKKTADC